MQEAQAANQSASNYREDISYLTKEQNRLVEELRLEQEKNASANDRYRRLELEFQEFRENGHVRDETVRRELESLRSLKELNHRDIEEFKRQNEQLIH